MIPFLKRRMPDAIIIKKKVGDGALEDVPEMDASSLEGLTQAAIDLIRAIKLDSPEKVAQALKAAFEICDSQPHDEGTDV